MYLVKNFLYQIHVERQKEKGTSISTNVTEDIIEND
jgi:hypothetical protein